MEFLDKLLAYYDLSYDEYLSLTKDVNSLILPNSDNLIDMDKAIARIKLAIKNKEKIVIYGDYDTDGIMATSILVKAFKYLNYEVGYYIPCRYIDGYGLNKEKINQFKEKGYSLIITVDNGITLVDEVDYANSLGIDVIVSDHHEIGDKLPNAISIIHPVTSKLGDVIASGGAMAYYISNSLLGRSDDYLLTLAMISTISDLMELKEYNRDMVRIGLDILNKNDYLQFSLLNDGNKYDEKSIGMRIVPRINSIGRIKEDISINNLVKYFVSDDELFINKYFSEINNTNELRKELTLETFNKVSEDLNLDNPGIIELLPLKEGLIGLLANKLLNDYNKPSLILTYDKLDSNLIKGSLRSKNGFNVASFIKENESILESGGGHANAGGISINVSNYEELKSRFLEYAKSNPLVEEKEDYIDISLNDLSFKNEEILRSFSPFGVGNKEPLFIIKNIPTKNLKYIKNDTILSTSVSYTSKLLGFNMKKSEVDAYKEINIIGTIRINEYKGYKTVNFQIEKYQNAL